jgi:hypothetical protein
MAELPTGMPWYFGAAILGIWLATLAAIYRVAGVLRTRRRGRRPPRRGRRPALNPARSSDDE